MKILICSGNMLNLDSFSKNHEYSPYENLMIEGDNPDFKQEIYLKDGIYQFKFGYVDII